MVPGRTVKVQLTSDGSITGWGFCVDRIETVSVGCGGLAESPHPYPNNYNNTWTLTNPDSNAAATRIHFSRIETESGYDFVTLRDANNNPMISYTGNQSDLWSIALPGRTVKVQLTSDGSITGWGFCVDRIETVTACPVYRAEYYNNRDLSGSPTFVQCEDWPINHDWGSGGPGNGVGNDNFSARWTGRAPIAAGTYTFIGGADDGIRVWLDGNLIIDQWHDQGYTEYRVTRSVSAGDHDVKVEYYENGGAARVFFKWEQQTGCTPGANGVVLYEHPNYQGRCVTFTGDDNDFNNDNFNDMASSIRFVGSYASGWEAVVYEHTYYGGVSSTFRGDDPDFGNDTIGHDRASSIRIQQSTCPNQYKAEYYNNRYLSGSPTFVQCENWPIDHDWGGGGPGHGVGNDNFSARWTGRAHIAAGTYTFIGGADDGIRVWIGGNLIIDQWHDQGYTEYRVTRNVSDGDYDIKAEYYENDGAARVYFRWEQVSTPTCSGTAMSFEQTVGGGLSNFFPSANYCFTASAGQWVSIRMFAYSGSLDTYIKLYTPDGQLFAENDDGAGVYNNSFLVRQLPQSGTYRLEATRYGSTSGDYRLRLEAGREAALGDLDRNCVVDETDRQRMVNAIGSSDQNADLNLDGIVNTVDYSILLGRIGRSCS
jgi:hypothetical protein